jgi:hypothetical protein
VDRGRAQRAVHRRRYRAVQGRFRCAGEGDLRRGGVLRGHVHVYIWFWSCLHFPTDRGHGRRGRPSRRPAVLWCLHAVDATRVHQTRSFEDIRTESSDRDAPRRSKKASRAKSRPLSSTRPSSAPSSTRWSPASTPRSSRTPSLLLLVLLPLLFMNLRKETSEQWSRTRSGPAIGAL